MKKCTCLFMIFFFKDPPMQRSHEEVTHWSGEEVCILNVSWLFLFLLFQLVEAMWEKSSLKGKALLLICGYK